MLDLHRGQTVFFRDGNDLAVAGRIDAAFAREGEHARIGHGAGDVIVGNDRAHGQLRIDTVVVHRLRLVGRIQKSRRHIFDNLEFVLYRLF